MRNLALRPSKSSFLVPFSLSNFHCLRTPKPERLIASRQSPFSSLLDCCAETPTAEFDLQVTNVRALKTRVNNINLSNNYSLYKIKWNDCLLIN
ncbi:hypothetical protein T4D_9024 [Trichinella pseudospiralis]|uniref:Uncharacterized protein n=1 Tax=Trichinella pseudospiralis TaxID=6337 RepID=A0A0V1FP43_TRIPS|nr:hypothetical protein T4D_9024 [Trichinella pseudospiralis]